MSKAAKTLALGLKHHQAGRLEEAEQIYRRILARDPDHADASHLLGLVAFQNKEPGRAIELIQKAIRESPSEPVYHDNLGKILQALGRAEEAAASFQEVLRHRPDDVEVYVRLGNSYCRAGHLPQACDCFRRALERNPNCVEACANLGHVLRQLGKTEEAVTWLRRAVEMKPDSVESLLNLSAVLQDRGEDEEAEDACVRALGLRPDLAEAHHNLGVIRKCQGRLEEAVGCYSEAARLKPDSPEPRNGLGVALLEQGKLEEAAVAFREALRSRPDYAAAHSNLLLCLNYDARQDASTVLAEHRRWGRQQAALTPTPEAHANDPTPGRRLRIGYVSPDFRTHPVAFFFGPILAAHNREEFACFCYSNVARSDAVTERLRSLADGWRDIRGLSDRQLADLVRQDRIDILVDLAGHTSDNRLPAFAAKPAPIQISYLGYSNTTGLTAIDYRITDGWADPPGEADQLHTEELVRLPSGFLCYQPFADAPAVGEPPVLHTGAFTFGSFNNLSKVTPEVIAVWSSILERAPGSRLLLKARALRDKTTRQRVLELFLRQGIAAERIELLGALPDLASHLEAYHHIDLALDTFPYNGTTTTCEALWMGVPVISLAGRSHASRVGLSLLSRIGHSEFVADSTESYVDLAVRLSSDPERLTKLRADLRPALLRSPLTDAVRFVRELEDAYRAIWRRWCTRAGEDPARASASVVGPEALRRRVAAFPYWYHRIELPEGVVTPGWAPIHQDAYRIPADLTGKRVLDVGAWDGFWTFEALKRGARQVVAIDDFSDLLGQLQPSDRRGWGTFDLCRELLGYDGDRCQRHEVPVYDVTQGRLGRFDIVFFFGTLYHLRHPLLALERLAAVCDEEIYVESAILDDYSPYRGGLGEGYPGGQMVMEFYPENQYGSNSSNWWVPTLHCLAHMVRIAGFPNVQAWKLTSVSPTHLALCRGFVKGGRNAAS